jgi:type I restriction enzyme S subunit
MSWSKKKLSEICNIKRGTTITEKQSIKGNIPVVAGGLKPAYYHNQPNRFNITITVSGSGANAGFVNLWKCPIFASDCSTVEVKDTSCDIFFIYYFLLSKQEYIYKNLRSGAAQPHVYAKDIANILIDVPPLLVQQKILAKLNKIFAEIDNLENNLKNKLIQIKKVNNILISSLVKKEKNLQKINLNSICDIKGRIGYRGYTKRDITTKDHGAISLSPSNIINSKLDFKKTTYVSWKKYEESPEIIINQGDIIFCKTGSTYGKTAYIESLPEKATLNPQLVVLKKIKCNKKYLFYYMMTENFKFQIEEIVGGTAMPTLSQDKLGQTIIELPSEISQKIIVNKIDQCNKNIEQIFINTKIIINNIHSLKSKALQTQLSL